MPTFSDGGAPWRHRRNSISSLVSRPVDDCVLPFGIGGSASSMAAIRLRRTFFSLEDRLAIDSGAIAFFSGDDGRLYDSDLDPSSLGWSRLPRIFLDLRDSTVSSCLVIDELGEIST